MVSPEYRDQYRRLRKNQKFTAAEAKRMILDDIAAAERKVVLMQQAERDRQRSEQNRRELRRQKAIHEAEKELSELDEIVRRNLYG